MKAKNLQSDLFKQLRNPKFATDYLNDALEQGDGPGFVLALRDVVDALGGVGSVAKDLNIHRVGLYKALSKNGNPLLSTVLETMSAIGFSFRPHLSDYRKFKTRVAVDQGEKRK